MSYFLFNVNRLHLVSLRRTASGSFRVEDALSPEPSRDITVDEFRARARRPADAVPHLPRVTLTPEESSRARHGRAPVIAPERIAPAPLRVPIPPGETGWPIALLTPDGELLALADAPGAPDVGGTREPGPPSPLAPVRLLRVFP